jgi:murein L,D-transpeptidase YcbB/YkuD
MAELNVPLETRKQQLRLAINYYRWLSCLSREQAVVVVNIPAAYLKVYELGYNFVRNENDCGKTFNSYSHIDKPDKRGHSLSILECST